MENAGTMKSHRMHNHSCLGVFACASTPHQHTPPPDLGLPFSLSALALTFQSRVPNASHSMLPPMPSILYNHIAPLVFDTLSMTGPL